MKVWSGQNGEQNGYCGATKKIIGIPYEFSWESRNNFHTWHHSFSVEQEIRDVLMKLVMEFLWYDDDSLRKVEMECT